MNYQLNWVRAGSGSQIVVELVGPGPDAQCRSVIQTMLNDGRVLSIHPDTQDRESVVLMLGVKEPELSSRFKISLTGLSSDLEAGCRMAQLATDDSAACS
jgi:hypothetical protein